MVSEATKADRELTNAEMNLKRALRALNRMREGTTAYNVKLAEVARLKDTLEVARQKVRAINDNERE